MLYLEVIRPSRFQPHPHFFQQRWIHAYCGKQLDQGVSTARMWCWSCTGFLETMCTHVMKWLHFILPCSLRSFTGDYLLVRKMQHLSKVLWTSIQTSHIQGTTSTKEQLREETIFALGLCTTKPRHPYWWKPPRSLKAVWEKYFWHYLVPNCLRLWRSSQCFSNYS